MTTITIDSAYLLLLGLVIAREIVAGRNWRNLRVLALVGLMFCANVAFHIEARFTGAAHYSERFGIAAIVMLVVLIGGRIVPSFTRNWLAKENPGRMPAAAGRLDELYSVVAAIGALCWIVAPAAVFSAVLLLLAAAVQIVRLAGWVGWRAWRDPLVLVLHGAYLFIPIGFVLHACAILHPDIMAPGAGIHAWTIGAVSGMILAVMTRATLGHTGRALRASTATIVVYLSIALSALARIEGALDPLHSFTLLNLSAAGWVVAFAGFALIYGPYLFTRRHAPLPR